MADKRRAVRVRSGSLLTMFRAPETRAKRHQEMATSETFILARVTSKAHMAIAGWKWGENESRVTYRPQKEEVHYWTSSERGDIAVQ